jgi:hypothetical protein
MDAESCAALFWAPDDTAMIKVKRANAPNRKFFNFTSKPPYADDTVSHQLEPESHPLYQTGGKLRLTFPPGLAASHQKPKWSALIGALANQSRCDWG